jgi:hypothetical protein
MIEKTNIVTTANIDFVHEIAMALSAAKLRKYKNFAEFSKDVLIISDLGLEYKDIGKQKRDFLKLVWDMVVTQ